VGLCWVDPGHHKNAEGFGPAELDKVALTSKLSRAENRNLLKRTEVSSREVVHPVMRSMGFAPVVRGGKGASRRHRRNLVTNGETVS
jgi:hypothetical protein